MDFSKTHPFLSSHLQSLIKHLSEYKKGVDTNQIQNLLPNIRKSFSNSNVKKFRQAIADLPEINPDHIDLNSNAIKISSDANLSKNIQNQLKSALELLIPWRKGPFNIFDILIDTEWQSNIKWDRIKDHLPDLKNKKILDIGCSSGYYMFRMLAQNPGLVLGIDSSYLFFYQFYAVNKYLKAKTLFYLPIKFEQANMFAGFFDIVFFMGVLYHNKSPIDILKQISSQIRAGGKIIVETLIYPGTESIAFSPPNRYAKMPNVYFIPTISCLQNWLHRAGYKEIKVVSVSKTTYEEQRKTNWMRFETICDFLDPSDNTKTIEGFPAPQRAVVIAGK